jgi:2-polyprenyl-3-methyl-5-hydroxy-6-metoxy-1,4-benzoquinol methylase
MCNPSVSHQESESSSAFEERLVQALNEAGMVLMLSLGHRAGLLEAMADSQWRSSSELAGECGLNERYVREWLGSMTVSGVTELDGKGDRYRLPPEHATLLTNHGEANLAVYAQYVPGLAVVEDRVLHCFRHGGGVDYPHYARFHEIMAEDSSQTVIAALFDHILPLIPGLTERLDSGIRVLDAGCGRGLALMTLAERFPSSTFVGYDLSYEALDFARQRTAERGLANLSFETRDLSDFDETATPAAFDFVTTFDAIHDQAWPLKVLTGIRRSLTADGVYLAQDIRASGSHAGDRAHPLGSFLYAISTLHCMTVSLAQGGEGLGTMWGRQKALQYLQQAGFSNVEVHELEHDIQNDYFVCQVKQEPNR